jgi:Zn-dependent peptidase ImmA (M78 family)/transcriptional regulator with XRE-family HTH domain
VEALRAHGVQLTKAALSKYECAKSVPSVAIVHALAAIFGIGAEFLIDARLPALRWDPAVAPRKSGKRRSERAAAAVILQFGSARALRRALEVAEIDRYVAPLRIERVRDAEDAAAAARAAWQLGTAQLVPSVVAMIEELGGLVVEDGAADDLFDALAGWVDRRIPVVVLNPRLGTQQRRDCIARELGHLLLDLSALDARVKKAAVDRFVRAFLLPAELMRAFCGAPDRVTYQDLAQLAVRAGVTFETCLVRATELQLIEPLDELRLARRVRAHAASSNELDAPIDESPKALARLAELALAAGILTRAQAARLAAAKPPAMQGSGRADSVQLVRGS